VKYPREWLGFKNPHYPDDDDIAEFVGVEGPWILHRFIRDECCYIWNYPLSHVDLLIPLTPSAREFLEIVKAAK
jgi:hypothetical protein